MHMVVVVLISPRSPRHRSMTNTNERHAMETERQRRTNNGKVYINFHKQNENVR